ncbi:MAG: flippase-like domain-containing protein [Bacteroidetes bacterium]|nr:flippase-like domain-containing protein [Bacteroidota bacterium]
MKKYILPSIKFLVFLGLGAFLIWLAVKDLTEDDKMQIEKSLSEANYVWIALSMAAGILAHISRAIRWKMLLAPLGFVPKLNNTFYAVMVGYLGNLAFPRLGEVLRCGILKRYEKIPLPQSFGTVITERVIDVFILFCLFIVSTWLEYERIKTYLTENIIHPMKLKFHSLFENKMMLFLLLGIFIVALLAIFIFRKKIFQNPIVQKIRTILLNFLEGIRSVAKVNNLFLFVFHSLFIWSMYFMSLYICVFTFNETKSMTVSDCLVIMTFGSLGVIATPGGIGAYQWIVLQIMLLWGYSTAMGVAFGWVAWLAQTAVVLLVGLLSFGLLAINNKEK